ncbi:MAG: DUF4375 domain-containing protein [Burkholderiales bacterium]|nr:MAG: DUF4375 domain-containing protein [Burkholderiales bacterium]
MLTMSRPSLRTDIDAAFIATRSPWEVVEPMWWSVSVFDGPQQYERDLQRFSREQRLMFACMCYVGEVNTGGHEQFYANNVGIVWRDALAGFQAFGETEVARILEASVERLGGAPSLDRSERFAYLLRLRPDFRDLDERFYRLESSRPLQDSLARTMRRNPTAFLMSGLIPDAAQA